MKKIETKTSSDESKSAWKRAGSILLWALIGILSVVVLLIGIVFAKSLISPNEVPSLFGYKPFIVMSGSMETEIYEGDLVFAKVVEPETLAVGDIISFRENEGTVVTHRIAEIVNDDGELKFYTKGDVNNSYDVGFVTVTRLEGLYVGKISGAGRVVLVMQEPTTLIIVLVIIALVAVIVLTKDKSKLTEEERNELERLRRDKRKEPKTKKTRKTK